MHCYCMHAQPGDTCAAGVNVRYRESLGTLREQMRQAKQQHQDSIRALGVVHAGEMEELQHECTAENQEHLRSSEAAAAREGKLRDSLNKLKSVHQSKLADIRAQHQQVISASLLQHMTKKRRE